MKLRIIFFGTPEYAVPVIDYLMENESLVGIVTRSDKMAGRYCQVTPSPVKIAALSRNIPFWTPEKLNDPEFVSWLADKKPDIAVVLAYGKIIPLDVLKIFSLGNTNIHFSLLPSYRGAAPVQWAIIKGEKETGVTSFMMDEKLDTGKIICRKRIGIEHSDDMESLRAKLVKLSLEVLKESFTKIKNGEPGCIQKDTATYAPKLKKSDGKINWEMPAESIFNLVRGTKPWPCAFVEFPGRNLKIDSMKILECEVVEPPSRDCMSFPVGSVASFAKDIGFTVKCGSGFLLIKTVHPSSKNAVSAWAFLQGHKIKVGDVLG